VVHGVALTQGVERILLAGMHVARHRERVGDGADGFQARAIGALQLRVQERHVELRVVD
jgi:hypothetical protein